MANNPNLPNDPLAYPDAGVQFAAINDFTTGDGNGNKASWSLDHESGCEFLNALIRTYAANVNSEKEFYWGVTQFNHAVSSDVVPLQKINADGTTIPLGTYQELCEG